MQGDKGVTVSFTDGNGRGNESVERWVESVIAEYAQRPPGGTLDARLSLRDDLAIESLSLVSLVVRLGDALGIDAAADDDGLSLGELRTVGDVVSLAQRFEERARAVRQTGAAHTVA
jgi:acyl carrier protein